MRTQTNTAKQATTTITIRIEQSMKDDLDALASATRRSRSFLSAEAIRTMLASEMEIVRGIECGLADMDAGRMVSHEQAMKRVNATIERVAHRKKK